MAGLHGDDESDLKADRGELFGVVPPIPIDVDVENVDAGPGDNPVADVVDDGTVITGGAKKRKATSEAWNDFEKIFETINGKQVRTGAKCFHCGKYYATWSYIGTGHLNRHVLTCLERKKNIRQS
jgi:hypothetical protein